MLKKILIGFLIILLIVFGIVIFKKKSSQSSLLKTDTPELKIIKSASEFDYPPFCVVTKDGQADGFSVELLRAALAAENFDVSFYVGPWDQIKQDLTDGKIQVLPLVARSPEREELYDFTEPYLTFYGAIFVREGETDIKTDQDLFNKEIAVLKGDASEEYVRRENISQNIVTVLTYEEAFRRLANGEFDAVVAQQRMGTDLLKGLDIKNVIALDYRLDKFRQDFTFAVHEGDDELLKILDAGLSKVIFDGTFDQLHKKWFVESNNDKFSYWLIFGSIIIVFFAVFLTSFYFLKK